MATYAAEVMTDTPLVYLKLGESSGTTAADASGNSRTGTYFNTPTLGVTGIPGAITSAVTFTGASSEYCQISASTVFYVESGTSITVEFWYKGTDTGNTAAGGSLNSTGLVCCSTGPTQKRWVVALDGSGKVRGYSDTDYKLTGPSTTSVNDGNWHHIVFQMEVTTANTTLYIDGTSEATNTAPTGSGTGTTNVTIGWHPRGTTKPYVTGTIDEVAIYGSLLSGARITAHHNAGKAGIGSAAGVLDMAETATGVNDALGSASGPLTLAGSATGSGEAAGFDPEDRGTGGSVLWIVPLTPSTVG